MKEKNFEEEISIKEILTALFKKWKFLAICVTITTVIGCVYVFGFEKTEFESSVNGTFIPPVTVETQYGKYNFPSTNISFYTNEATNDKNLQKTIESLNLDINTQDLKSQITILSNGALNSFSISVRAGSTQESYDLLTEFSGVFIDDINLTFRENAIDTFIIQCDQKSEQYQEVLENAKLKLSSLEDALSKISPVITLKKLITSDPDLAATIAYEHGIKNLSELTDNVMLYEEVVNPEYTAMNGFVVETKKDIFEIQTDITRNAALTEQLKGFLDGIKRYRESGDTSGLTDESLNVLKPFISIADSSDIESYAVTPNRFFSLAVFFIFGLVIGMIAVLIKYFYKKRA